MSENTLEPLKEPLKRDPNEPKDSNLPPPPHAEQAVLIDWSKVRTLQDLEAIDPVPLTRADRYRLRVEKRLAKLREKNAPKIKTRLSEDEKYRKRVEAITKARAAIEERKRQKAIVEEKVRNKMPITEQEKRLLLWRPGKSSGNKAATPGTGMQTLHPSDEVLLAEASKLLIKPKHVNELRAMVEQLAHKHGYNPLEELILMTKPERNENGDRCYKLPPEKRVEIHKTLLPFLVPQLKAAAPPSDDPAERGPAVKVVIAQYEFQPDPPQAQPLYAQKPVTVDTNQGQAEPT